MNTYSAAMLSYDFFQSIQLKRKRTREMGEEVSAQVLMYCHSITVTVTHEKNALPSNIFSLHQISGFLDIYTYIALKIPHSQLR